MANEIDIGELARMIRAKRGTRGLRAIADEIGDVSASTLSRIEQGKVPDLDTFIRLCKWLGVSADHFTVNTESTSSAERPSTSDFIAAHLRADRALDPQTADIAYGYSPGKKIRGLLGLPAESSVVVMAGEVPAGSQAVAALQCECGQWFIANHPRRRRCFVCSPYKGRRVTS